MSLNKSFTGRLFPSAGKRPNDPATSTNTPNPRNNNRMSETNSGGGRNGETIVNRLHDAINVYRQERDDIFRRKETAKERLRLVKEEKEALTKSVQMMQDKAGQLTDRITTSKQKIETVRHEVLRLTSEVSLGSKCDGFLQASSQAPNPFLFLLYVTLRPLVCTITQKVNFQHSELLGSRDKIKQIEGQSAMDGQERASILDETRERVHARRQKMRAFQNDLSDSFPPNTKLQQEKNVAPTMTTIQQLTAELEAELEAELDDVTMGEYNWSKLPKNLEQKAVTVSRRASNLARERESMERIIAGYERMLGAPLSPAVLWNQDGSAADHPPDGGPVEQDQNYTMH
jgi:chromosome segregation ATPase